MVFTIQGREGGQNVLAMLNQQLSQGWEAKLTEHGRIYYINHHTENTSWTPPVENWDTSNGLPYGYEAAVDREGKTYYLNHNENTTTQDDPRDDPDYVEPPKPRNVELIRDPQKGFGFVAGSEKPVVVRFVTDDGPSVNKLMAGDQIMKINGEDVKRAPREYVIDLVRSCQESISLTVCQPYYDNCGRKSALLTAAKKAKLKSNPSRVRFAEAVSVNGSPIQSPATHESYVPFMPNVLKVFLENGQTRSFKYDNKTSVQDVMDALQEKLNIQCIEHFALVLQNTRHSSNKMSILQPKDTLAEIACRPTARHFKCLFRLSFVPKDAYDLLRRDAVAFEYFYMQCCNDVVLERFASELKYDTALKLGSLQVQQHAMTNNMTGKITVKAVEREFGLEKFVPQTLLHAVKIKDIRKMLAHYMKSNQGLTAPGQKQLTALQAKLHYLKIVGELRAFGGKCFLATLIDKHTDGMLLVGPKCGISQVSNIKTYNLKRLADFDLIESIVLKKDTHNSRIVELRLADGGLQPIRLGLLNDDTAEFLSYVLGYYRVFVKRDGALITDENANENDGVPPYHGKHRVITTSWSYPEDLVSVIESEKEGKRDSEMSENERVVDFCNGPPPYQEGEEYIAKIKEDLGIKAPIPEDDEPDSDDELDGNLANIDIDIESDSNEDTHALDLLVQSFNMSCQDDEAGAETDNEMDDTSSENNDSFGKAPHDIYMGHDDEKYNTQVHDDEVYDEQYCAEFKSMLASKTKQEHSEADWVMGLDVSPTSADEDHHVLEHAKDSVAMRKRHKRASLILTVGFESDEFSGSSPERNDTSLSPKPKDSLSLTPPRLFQNNSDDDNVSFGLRSPRMMPSENLHFFNEDIVIDSDLIDLTLLPPPEPLSNEPFIDFSESSTSAPPPGFSDSSHGILGNLNNCSSFENNSEKHVTTVDIRPSRQSSSSLSQNSTFSTNYANSSSSNIDDKHNSVDDSNDVPVSMIDVPSPLLREMDSDKLGDEELRNQLAAIDALSIGDCDKKDTERESGIESESDSGNETIASENVDYQRGATPPHGASIKYCYATEGRLKHSSKNEDVESLIQKYSIPPPPDEEFQCIAPAEMESTEAHVLSPVPLPVPDNPVSSEDHNLSISEDDVVSTLLKRSASPVDVNHALSECLSEVPPAPAGFIETPTALSEWDVLMNFAPDVTVEPLAENVELTLPPPVLDDSEFSDGQKCNKDLKSTFVIPSKTDVGKMSDAKTHEDDDLMQKVLSESNGSDSSSLSSFRSSISRPKAPPPPPPARKSSISDEISVLDSVNVSASKADKYKEFADYDSHENQAKNHIENQAEPKESNSPKRSAPVLKESPEVKKKSWYSAFSRGKKSSKHSYNFGSAQEEFEHNFDADDKMRETKDVTENVEILNERQGRDRTVKNSERGKSPDRHRMTAKEAFSKLMNITSRKRTGSLDRTAPKTKSDSSLLKSKSVSIERDLNVKDKPESNKVSRARSFHIPKPKFLRGRSPSRTKEITTFEDTESVQANHTSAEIHGTFPRFRSKPSGSPLSSKKRMTFDLSKFGETGQIADSYETGTGSTDKSIEDVALTGLADMCNDSNLDANGDIKTFATFGKSGDDQLKIVKVQRHQSLDSKNDEVRNKYVYTPVAIKGTGSLGPAAGAAITGKSPAMRSALPMTRTSLRPNSTPQIKETSKKTGPMKAMHVTSPVFESPVENAFSEARESPMPVKPPRRKSQNFSPSGSQSSSRASTPEISSSSEKSSRQPSPAISRDTSSHSLHEMSDRKSPSPLLQDRKESLLQQTKNEPLATAGKKSSANRPTNLVIPRKLENSNTKTTPLSSPKSKSPLSSPIKRGPPPSPPGGKQVESSLCQNQQSFSLQSAAKRPVPPKKPELLCEMPKSPTSAGDKKDIAKDKPVIDCIKQNNSLSNLNNTPVKMNELTKTTIEKKPLSPRGFYSRNLMTEYEHTTNVSAHVDKSNALVQDMMNDSAGSNSTFNSSTETVVHVQEEDLSVETAIKNPQEISEIAYKGENSFSLANGDINCLLKHLKTNLNERKEATMCSPMKFKQRKDLLVFQARAFVTDSKLLVSSATQTKDKLLLRLNNSMHTLAKIYMHTENVLSVLNTTAQADSLVSTVIEVTESYRKTLNTAQTAAGKPLANADMKALMRQATNLASILSSLMKTLKTLDI